MTVLLESLTAADQFFSGGLMFHNIFDANAANFFLRQCNNGVNAQYCTVVGAETSAPVVHQINNTSVWLKIEKIGNRVRSYYASFGSNLSWVRSGFSSDITWNEQYYVGLAVTTQRKNVSTTLNVSNFSMVDSLVIKH